MSPVATPRTAPLVVVEHLGAGKAGIDFDAQRFGLFAQPAAHLAEADDVVAVVLETAGQEEGRQIDEAVLRQEGEAVAADGRIQRRAKRLPVGDQFVQRTRIHDRAGKDMGADFRALLDQADIDFGIDLFQADRGGKSGGTSADDHDVEFHGFALHTD